MYILEPRCPTTKLSTKPTRELLYWIILKGAQYEGLCIILFNFDHRNVFSCTTVRAKPVSGTSSHLVPGSIPSSATPLTRRILDRKLDIDIFHL